MDKEQRKKNRKGFLRNSAINVVEDIINVGNPLNPGGHLIGSIADGILMEAGDRRMTKNMYNNLQQQTTKQASEYLDELYMEKTANPIAAIGRVVGNLGKSIAGTGVGKAVVGSKAGQQAINGVSRYKQLLTGSNLANMGKDVATKQSALRSANYNLNQSKTKFNALNDKIKAGDFAGKSEQAMNKINANKQNLAKDVLNNKAAVKDAAGNLSTAYDGLAAEKNKVLATRVATGGVAGLGAKHVIDSRQGNERNASEYLNELYMEKTAGIGSIGKKVTNSRIATKLMNNEGLRRTGELLTGSKARSIAREIKDIENQKNNLNLFQKATGKKFRLNRLQNKKYRDFDIEAANVSRARKTAAGAGALGVGSGVVAKTYVEDKRREPMYPIN